MNLPWILIGDFNNVLCCQDKIGGNPMMMNEYKDLIEIMQHNGLYEAPSKGCYYT